MERFDRFGVAHGVLAVADGATPAELTARLRGLSGLDRVLEQLTATAAPVRYERIDAALTPVAGAGGAGPRRPARRVADR